jgi:hypothetical protein
VGECTHALVQCKHWLMGSIYKRNDKVALFKALRENLERIKAGTLDTGSMPIICLPADGH